MDTKPTDLPSLLSTTYEDLPVWVQLAEVIEEVFKVNIQDPVDLMLSLRYLSRYDQNAFDKQNTGKTLIETDKRNYERAIYILASNLLGFTYKDNSLLDSYDYRRIHSNVGAYYPEKGTEQFINFFGFASNAIFGVETLWSDQTNGAYNYGNFIPSLNNAPPGFTSVTMAGIAFPTTHVNVYYDLNKYGTINPQKILSLAKYLSPINLVFKSISGKLVTDPSILYVSMAAQVNIRVKPPLENATLNFAMMARIGVHIVPPRL